MIAATGQRIRWADLPGNVGQAAEEILGDEVESTESRAQGDALLAWLAGG